MHLFHQNLPTLSLQRCYLGLCLEACLLVIMPSAILNQEERDAVVNFGCALVQSGLTLDYSACEYEAPISSLLERLGANKFIDQLVIAQIPETVLTQCLENWWIPVPVPVGVPADQAEDSYRRLTAIELHVPRLPGHIVVRWLVQVWG